MRAHDEGVPLVCRFGLITRHGQFAVATRTARRAVARGGDQ